MNPRPRFVLWLLLCCIVMGALPAIVQAVFATIGWRAFLLSSLFGFIYAACISVPAWILLSTYLCRRTYRGRIARALVYTVVLAICGVAGCFVANLILIAIHLMPAARLWPVFWWSLRVCLLIAFTAGVMALAIGTLMGELHSVREQLHRSEVEAERERKTAAEARYASLESRVRPHFLFNTLNSISALVRDDPEQAERMIERLAGLLRFSLDSELAGLVTLGEELRVVRDYLDIERVRFGARLRFSIHAEDEALACSIPALAVQTLVENSVKFAVGVSGEGAEIGITALVRNGRLRIEVHDDGPGFDPALQLRAGHGLDLLQRRLHALFGDKASLEMDGAAGLTRVAVNVTV